MAVDMDKLQEFLGRFVTDLGATFAAGNVVTGHHLGLYRALAAGPARAAELAERTSTNPRYITEWLRGQAAVPGTCLQPSTSPSTASTTKTGRSAPRRSCAACSRRPSWRAAGS